MENDELALGIDLGTTFSCMAILRNNKVEIIPNEIGENITPSIVSFSNNQILVGEQAISQLIMNPKKTIYSIKRLMGKNYDDPQVKNDIESHFYNFDIEKSQSGNRPLIKIEDNNTTNYYFPEQISKIILEKLVQSAKDYLQKPVKKAVITVPAYFNDTQRNATKFAAEKAGLEVLRIINEPTAASLAYGLERKLPKKSMNQGLFNINLNKNNDYHNYYEDDSENEEKLIIVFDLGGGTFDVTLLNIYVEDGESYDFNIISSKGDSHLGGDDFDKKISDYCIKQFCSKFENINEIENEIKNDTKLMNRLKIASEKAKIQLSSELQTVIDMDEFYENQPLHIVLTREIFENICEHEFNRLLEPLKQVLEDSKKNESDIKEIVFVGGSTRIPKVKEFVKNFFVGKININDSINPDETVAYGAAIQAGKLMRHGSDILNDIILMDITPFSLGIETINENKDWFSAFLEGGKMSVLISRGTKIPVIKSNIYITTHDDQEECKIVVYEGENIFVRKNHLIGEFTLSNLPKKPKGEVKVNVTFEIDTNGILIVTGELYPQGMKKSIKIINDKGFNEKEITENINRTNNYLANRENKEIKNFKKEMGDYYKYYIESSNKNDKSKYILNFTKTLVNFIDTFEKEGNDTLGNKYFLYIKTLFDAYRAFIQLNDIDENEKHIIINNSKKYLKILSTFKNTNYKNYIELLNFFLIDLSQEQKYKPIELRTSIEDSRNFILFDLVIYTIELLEEKAEKILSSNSKFSRYNSRYLFKNCIQISELFIKSDRELSKFFEIKNRHKNVIEKCKAEIKKINANSLIEIDKIKREGILFEKTENLKREEILIMLDNYREAFQNMEGVNDLESEAIILANIVKIKYKYLSSYNETDLRHLGEQSIHLALSLQGVNVQQFKWFVEIKNIVEELRRNFEDKEREEQKDFEKECKEKYKNIFDEIEEAKKKTFKEFIEFILKEHPPYKSPIRKGKTLEEEWNNNEEDGKKKFIERLSARYNPDNYPKNSQEEKKKFTIYNEISKEINSKLSLMNPNPALKL